MMYNLANSLQLDDVNMYPPANPTAARTCPVISDVIDCHHCEGADVSDQLEPPNL